MGVLEHSTGPAGPDSILTIFSEVVLGEGSVWAKQ